MWLDSNIIVELLFIDSHTKYIKGVLVIITADLEKKSEYQREQWDFTVLAKQQPIENLRYIGGVYSK